MNNNTIGFKILSNTPPANYYYGIRAQNCSDEIIQQNYIYKYGQVPSSSFENSVYGISEESNISNASVLENSVIKLGNGLRFRSYNGQSNVKCNIMTQNWAGLTVDAVNIGQQGQPVSLSYPYGLAGDNQWSTIPSNMAGSVSVRGVGAYTQTPFYTRSANYPWCPALLNIVPVFPNNPIIVPSTNGTSFLVSSAPQNCSNICYLPPCNYNIHAKIAQNQNPFNLVTGNSRFMMQQDLLKAILADSIIDTDTSTDALILKYYRDTTLANTNMGIIATVSSKYAGGDTLGAEALNLTIDPKQCAEMYHKIVNGIFFKTWARNIFYFSPSDSLILHDIAIQDPLICGTAIYDARVMMGIDVNDYSVENNNKSVGVNSEENVIIDKIGILYPNPANKSCTYEVALSENETGFIILYDLNGKMLQSNKLQSGNNKLILDLSEFDSGVYIYKIIINGEMFDYKKLVIVR